MPTVLRDYGWPFVIEAVAQDKIEVVGKELGAWLVELRRRQQSKSLSVPSMVCITKFSVGRFRMNIRAVH